MTTEGDNNNSQKIDNPSTSSKPKRQHKYEILKEYGYELKKTIGKGSYAIVKLATSKELNFDVAIRIISLEKAGEKVREKFLPRELEIVKLLNHPNLVFFYQIIKTNLNVYMVMEYGGRINLRDELEYRTDFPENQVAIIFTQIANGLRYMHKLSIAHRDLKTENILLNDENHVKIADFGFSRSVSNNEHSRTYCGSYSFAAFEILCGKPYNPMPADIWSLGVILYNIAEGELPFDETNLPKLVKQIKNRGLIFRSATNPAAVNTTTTTTTNASPDAAAAAITTTTSDNVNKLIEEKIPRVLSTDLITLIKAMVTTDWENRINIKGVLMSPFVQRFKSDVDKLKSDRKKSSLK